MESGAPAYTREDMRALSEMSEPGTFLRESMEECEYDPAKVRALLESYHLKKDLLYLFDMPLKDLPKHVDDRMIMGYIRFRFTVRK